MRLIITKSDGTTEDITYVDEIKQEISNDLTISYDNKEWMRWETRSISSDDWVSISIFQSDAKPELE